MATARISCVHEGNIVVLPDGRTLLDSRFYPEDADQCGVAWEVSRATTQLADLEANPGVLFVIYEEESEDPIPVAEYVQQTKEHISTVIANPEDYE